jgi:acetylglutamate kinase
MMKKKLSLFLDSFSGIDAFKILVHGGGKIATSIGNKLGIESKYINGRRITDDETIDLVTMVYGGLINKKIVAQLQSFGCNAIGLSGADGNLIPATKRGALAGVDYGWAGDVSGSRLQVAGWQVLLQNAFVPVVAPLTHDECGHILNTNADTIASTIAVALSRLYDVGLIYCFEKKGVLENVEDENSVIHSIDHKKYQQLLSEKKLVAGILPKIDNAFVAIRAGVKEVLIGDANDLMQNTAGQVSGTLITN